MLYFQYANLLAGSVYIPLSSWLVVSPGSVVLFPAILFLVLFVYLSEDAVEARKLIYGVAIANLVFLPMGLIVAQQLQSAPPSYQLRFTSRPTSSACSRESSDLERARSLHRHAHRLSALRVGKPIHALDFSARLPFADAPRSILTRLRLPRWRLRARRPIRDILLSQLAGKTVAALALLDHPGDVSAYFFVAAEHGRGRGGRWARFRVLTYRQRYPESQKINVRDALTNVYNRGFFDEALEKYDG